MAAGAAIALIVALAVATAIVRRRRRAESLQAPLPLIPFSTASGISVPPRPDGMLRPPSRSPYADVVNAATPAWNPTVPNAGRENAGRFPYMPPHQSPPVAGRSG